jgi:hypothetical protein
MKIRVETKLEGIIEKEVNIPGEEEGLTWVEITREFIDVLRGLGYIIPEDFEDYLNKK